MLRNRHHAHHADGHAQSSKLRAQRGQDTAGDTAKPAAAAPAAAAWAAAASCATTRPTSAQTRSTRAPRPPAHSSAAPAQLHIFQNIAAAVQNSDANGGRGEAVAERRWTSAAVQEQRRVEAHHAAASPETQPLMRGSARCRRSLARWQALSPIDPKILSASSDRRRRVIPQARTTPRSHISPGQAEPRVCDRSPRAPGGVPERQGAQVAARRAERRRDGVSWPKIRARRGSVGASVLSLRLRVAAPWRPTASTSWAS